MGDSRTIMIKIDADGRAAVVETEKTTRAMEDNLEGVNKAASEVKKTFETLNIKSNLDIEAEKTRIVAAFERIKNSGYASAAEISSAYTVMQAKLAGLDQSLRTHANVIGQAEQKIKDLAREGKFSSDRLSSSFDNLGIKSALNIEAEKARIIASFEQIKSSGVASAAEISRAHAAMQSKLSGLDQSLRSTTRNADGSTSSILGIGSAAALAKITALSATVGIASKQLLDAGISAERFRNSFEAATGSAVAGQNALAFVRAESLRLGIDLQTAADGFLKISAAAKGTSLEGEKTKLIFSSVAEASRALGLPSEQVNGTLLAIGQMMSKGTVQSEELRGQLGERLPGAFQIAARSMGVSTAELGKMLEQGQVMSDDFLPKFAAELQKTFPAGEKAVSGLSAEVSRLSTAWYELKVAAMDAGGESMFKSFITGTKDAVNEIGYLIKAARELHQLIRNPFNFQVTGTPRRDLYGPTEKPTQPLNRFDTAVIGMDTAMPSASQLAPTTTDWMFQSQQPIKPFITSQKIATDSKVVKDSSVHTDEKKEQQAMRSAARLESIAQRHATAIANIQATAADRILVIGAERDESKLTRLAATHRKEQDQLLKNNATQEQMDTLVATQRAEREKLVANQKEQREYQSARTSVKIAEAEFQAKSQWLDKLEAYQIKTGQMDESAAVGNRYQRERDLLTLKQDALAVEILHEKEQSKQNELAAEYWRIQKQIEQSTQQQVWAEQELNQKRFVAAYSHQQNMANIQQAAIEARLQFIGQEQAAIDASYAYRQQQLMNRHTWEMQNLQLNHDEKLAKEREYMEQRAQLDNEYAQRRAQQYWQDAQTYIGFAQSMSTMGIQMLLAEEGQRDQIGKRMLATGIRFLAQQLQQFMFMKAKENIIAALSVQGRATADATAATANLSILEAQATAWAAFYAAMSLNPYGGQTFIPAATAMTAVAGVVVPASMGSVAAATAASVSGSLAMAAMWAAGGVLVGALGEGLASSIEGTAGGSASTGAGTYSSPTVTTGTSTTATTTTTPEPIVNVHIYGNVVDHDQFAREMTSALKKAWKDAA